MKTITAARVAAEPERFVIVTFDPAAGRVVHTTDALNEAEVHTCLADWTAVDREALLHRARASGGDLFR